MIATSPARITRLIHAHQDVLFTWTAPGGTTNVVEATDHLHGTFTPISPEFILSGAGNVTANFLDVGALTNSVSRFYRIRLMP